MDMKSTYNLCGEGSLLSQYCDEFILADIFKYTGLSLKDWLNLPRFNQNTIKSSVERKKQIETAVNNQLNSELNEIKNK